MGLIRVMLAEDQRILREALAALLGQEDDLDVVAQVGRGDEVVRVALETRPDVAVLDIEMPGADGLTAAAALTGTLPDCRVIMLTGVGRPGHLRRAVAAGAAGAAGFLPKDCTPERLADAIRAVAAGEKVVDDKLALAALGAPDNPLTAREVEVLRALATGAEPAEAARELFISHGTLRNYVASAVTKLNARNRMDAVRIADQAGWI